MLNTFQEISQVYLVFIPLRMFSRVLAAPQGPPMHFVPEGPLGLLAGEHGLLPENWKHGET